MQLRYLQEIVLKKADKKKQLNGTYIDEYKTIDTFKVQFQDLENEVDASIYGSDVINMLRLKSPNLKLENYLIPKVNNKEDNISKYFIFINNVQYKIKAVSKSKIDIQRI